jgi:glycosyltransferase involved in cell wall biosynthesis
VIRALHIAEELAREHEVRLVSTRGCEISRPDIDCRHVLYKDLRPHVRWADVVIFQGYVMYKAPWLAQSSKALVVDLYDPMHLEQLAMAGSVSPEVRVANVNTSVQVLDEQIMRGDFFLCASEQQRHFWLGHLAALGRLNVTNYDADSSARSLLAVCPFGLPATPATRTAPAIKGVVPGIGPQDKLILWAGGVYNWFDPLTLVRAVELLRGVRPDVRLYFLGMAHPDPRTVQMRTAVQTRELSDSLGLTGKQVFFNEGWVPYAERQNYLLDADVGVSTHFDHLETTFAFRTRILDYLWAGLPVVSTAGDGFADLIEREGIGLAVPEQDPPALADALGRVLGDVEFAAGCRRNVARIRADFTWERSLQPLLAFCRDPRLAPDRAAGTAPLPGVPFKVESAYQPSIGGDLGLFVEYYRQGGIREVARRAAGRLRRRRAR